LSYAFSATSTDTLRTVVSIIFKIIPKNAKIKFLFLFADELALFPL
jgi:hypothetical protein